MAVNFPSSATLTGARQISFGSRVSRQEDLGFKVERLISSINDMISVGIANMSAIVRLNSAVTQTNTTVSSVISTISGIAGNFSLVSGAGLSTLLVAPVSTTLAVMSNFRA